MRRLIVACVAVLVVGACLGTNVASRTLQEPIVYTVRVPAPDTHSAQIDAVFPTDGRKTIDLMMPVWSPGYYRLEDYALRIEAISARGDDGAPLVVRHPRPNRWQVETGGAAHVTLSYRLLCQEQTVTTNWVDARFGVFNGGATFVTLAEPGPRPHDIRVDFPASWTRVASGLPTLPGGGPTTFRAADFPTLVDSPIVAGDLDVREFVVEGTPHVLVSAGERTAWDPARAVDDLRTMVGEVHRFWGMLPFSRYVFLVVFRPSGGGLEHLNSTLVNVDPERMRGAGGFRRWLGLTAHEYFHAFNVKRLRPIELGPFDYESTPTSTSLWWSEGVTSYFSALMMVRAGLNTREEHLASLGGAIGQLQQSPGRLVQTVEQSSSEVWSNSLSGVNPDQRTVSYYTKGNVLGFVLDARIRRLTNGARSLDDLMRTAYLRYGGPRGFTPLELQQTAEELAGASLGDWFRRSISSTEELDYGEACAWFGLKVKVEPPADPSAKDAKDRWSLVVDDGASAEQRARLDAWLEGSTATAGVSR